ncbi:ATP-binding SpoIIE family protein phosphatase [Actinacidiphila guanduensis]|uniref:Serine phosphatase RsbU, regulator of sigma subunit n=1 Tax=Actinacidiphila guanduensis TaxID=310781 RepID=A0A1H0NQE0_9ACTN|nr:SpoIIE family protein phosphatase [Actinacidiphila guanduensis]SDO94924.1 Serine phosphatase RsbU, regulator of sigma subunit [Actinacidiphila guanduensis]
MDDPITSPSGSDETDLSALSHALGEAASGAHGRNGAGGGAGGAGPAGGGPLDAHGDSEQILGAVTVDRDLRIISANLDAPCFDGLTALPGEPFAALLPHADVPAVTHRMRRVLETGVPHVARVQRLPKADKSDLVVSLSILPSAPPEDGLTISFIDMARRLHLYAAATSIGTTLDVGETARALAASLLPWGDVAAVSLDYDVWTGEHIEDRARLRRAALAPDRAWPEGFLTTGRNLPEEAAVFLGRTRRHDRYGAFVLPDREAIEKALGNDPRLIRALVPDDGPLTVACVPLVVEDAAGDDEGPIVLGVAEVWRRPGGPQGPFGEDLIDIKELVVKTAKHVDNARRHQREHTQVLALQRRLLPPLPSGTIEVAHAYEPTTPDSAGVGGDWVSSFPLAGGGTALVVGDVVGHGLGAAASMGQLSMEARAHLSAGLPPDQVLARLDETVALLDESETGFAAGYSALNSTCCVVCYDPVDHLCTMCNAGNLPPILVHPDGRAELVAPPAHSGLGTTFATREPFTVHEFTAEPGSLLALYTDGLVEDPSRTIDEGIGALMRAVARIAPGDNLTEAVRHAVAELTPERPLLRDDVTLMVARMHGRPEHDAATLAVPSADFGAVSRARDLTVRRLSEWGLVDRVHEASLVVSELVTNALRHGGPDVTLRLIRTDTRRVVCEVRDHGNGRPWLHRVDPLGEGGRGLLLVHKLSTRWGVRWGAEGAKTTWAEIAA